VVVACRDPYLAMALVSQRFAELNSSVGHVRGASTGEVHASAAVERSARIGARVRVGAQCVVEAGASIGDGTVLYPGCYVGRDARIGADCVLFPRVTIYERVEVGNRVRLHAGVVLGADGFGYAPGPASGLAASGAPTTTHHKIYHFGRVVVGDDVEIGANSTVDRGTIADTVIGAGAKIDNLCHLGHNARLGRGAILCGGTFLAGNASVGDLVYVGGMSGVSNQVHVGDGAKVGAMSLLTKDVPPGETVAGNPQRTYREHFRAHAALNKLIQKPKQES
jgi:UDP-3-O-[3-hydroxymyristoyl] glucosamine N-acyltransferase